MDGKKVFLVVLALLAALFAVGAVFAARSEPPSKNPEQEPKPFAKLLGGWFGSMKPRARLAAKEFACGTSTSVGASGQAMRMLKLKLGDPCQVEIVYDRGPHPAKDDSDLDHQPWPQKDTKNRTSTSFVILKEGGTITFGTCSASKHSGCKVFVVED